MRDFWKERSTRDWMLAAAVTTLAFTTATVASAQTKTPAELAIDAAVPVPEPANVTPPAPSDFAAQAKALANGSPKLPDAKPADTASSDTKASDTKTTDTKPADAPAATASAPAADAPKAVDAKPADTKAADVKPADAKQADVKQDTATQTPAPADVKTPDA